MTDWLIALAAGLGFALLQYARPFLRDGVPPRSLAAPALFRAAAVTVLVALLLDARSGRSTSPAPLVAIDASQSWERGDTTRWASALARARTLGGDSLLLAGDSVRLAGDADRPRDAHSSIAPLIELAVAQGRPLVVFTDGEIDGADAAAADALPRGSRFEVSTAPRAGDAAIAALEAPRSLAAGDTLRATMTLRNGAAPVPARELALRLDDRSLATVRIAALAPNAVHDVSVAMPFRVPEGSHVLRAVLMGRDAEPRNDTLGVALEISTATAAVFVSSAPDLDGRAALALLRGALSIPTRGFLQVAPGTWRIDGTLEPVGEAAVRAAVAAAPMLVIHGDTAVFGPPRRLAGDAPLALMPGPGRSAPEGAQAVLDEWYPSAAPPSPAASALAGVAWETLPPVSLGADTAASAPVGAREWVAVQGRRGRRGDARPFVVGSDTPRRVVVARATGMSRWQARGDAGVTAYHGLWGSLFDWMADGRRDRRAAVPERASVREGDAVRWRIARADSAVGITLARRGDPAGITTLTLAAGAGSNIAASPPLRAGVYDVTAPGGRSVLVVNAAEELLPRALTIADGARGRGVVSGMAPALRDSGLAYALVVLLLCAEWALRRRQGLQ